MMVCCPNPKCHNGQVWHRGTTGYSGDNPSDFDRCPTCNGKGEVHRAWASAHALHPGCCRACGRMEMLGAGRLCHACWTKRHRPASLPVLIPLAEIPF